MKYQNKPDLKILLQPKSLWVGEVDVYGQLLIYKKMLQKCRFQHQQELYF